MFTSPQIIEPTLLLDEAKCKRNIRNMAEKALRNGVTLRPHFKTHQSWAIGEWFREAGVKNITVSSLKMACFFAEAGWNDITVAFPVNILESKRLNHLAGKIKLNVVIEDAETIDKLNDLLTHPLYAYIKVDIGYHRTGVDSNDHETIDAMIAGFAKAGKINLKGFLGHAGHSYNCRGAVEIQQVHTQSLLAMQNLYNRYHARQPGIEISVGDTPTCSTCENFGPATEIRPGNFVFYDLTQAMIGSNAKEDIAVALACPVVAKHKERNEVILYGGGVHFSKDFIDLGQGKRSYGEWVLPEGNGWSSPVEGCYMSKLSQEHGTLLVTPEKFEEIKTGDVLYILPVHSCMTANLMRGYQTLSGNQLDYMDYRKDYNHF